MNEPQIAEPLPPTHTLIRVTNTNPFPVTDMFDGVPYVFSPNTPISIPVAAAQHFFAWPSDDPKLVGLWVSKRLGWNTKADIEVQADGRPRWQHWVEKILVQSVEFDLVPRDPSTPIMADDGVIDAEPPIPAMPDEGIGGTRVGQGHTRPLRRVDV
jgi:hypothetical protein